MYKRITIPGTSDTPAKEFEVGNVYKIPSSDMVDFITVLEEITDKQLKFKILNPNPSKEYIRATTKQFSMHTKLATDNRQRIVRYIFEVNPEFL